MSETAARSVVDQLFHAGRRRAMAQMESRTRAPGSPLALWTPRRTDLGPVAVVAAVVAVVFGALKVVQTWLANPLGSDVGGVVVALLCGLVASSAVWRGEEGRAVRLLYADLQFAQRCVSGTRARVRAAAPTVPLAAGLVGPVDRAYAEVRRVCRKLRLDRNRALRGLAAFGSEVDWERTILLAHLEVLTAAVIAADEAVAMVASVSLAPVTSSLPELIEAPRARAQPTYVAAEILEVLAASLE